ncbi:Hypothetical protein NGAL_HAMBI1189_08690 [Neorhizobium galegae bv. officinalis]|uniref:Uncharacterized protein n=1 Tax=Neorhizobium galegae bv. officinalis TaxID=323656 RepID=A0A0T7GDS4_NEOGA|nr:Hypothetical protein NGAL_HAMBI1189_08690 [Neorhizobium galegae bv. officinalis]
MVEDGRCRNPMLLQELWRCGIGVSFRSDNMRISGDWLEDWISERSKSWQMMWFPSQVA